MLNTITIQDKLRVIEWLYPEIIGDNGMNDKYPHLDKCDGCNDKVWVRLVYDGEYQYCIKCDLGDCTWCFGDGCGACDDKLIEVTV